MGKYAGIFNRSSWFANEGRNHPSFHQTAVSPDTGRFTSFDRADGKGELISSSKSSH